MPIANRLRVDGLANGLPCARLATPGWRPASAEEIAVLCESGILFSHVKSA